VGQPAYHRRGALAIDSHAATAQNVAVNEKYDAIVLGVGGMGSAALCHLARRGVRVLGLEQFDVPHDLGSSHGATRVIRKAYFEDPRYVPLLHRAYELWRDLESEPGEKLLHICGCITIGPSEHPCVLGVRECAARHNLPHEILDAAEIRRRFPALRPAADAIGIHEMDAGALPPERCVMAHVAAARRHGAEVRTRQRVHAIEWNRDGVRVSTAEGAFHADKLIITAGPWLPQVLPIGLPLRVERQVQLWFQPREPDLFAPTRMPVFIYFLPQRSYYGLPAFDERGVKVCRHHGGATVTPETVDRTVTRADKDDVRAFVRAHLAPLDGPSQDGKVCLYTNTPDEHFIIGRLPTCERVVIAGGFSGHGFKFAAVVGEIVADLVVDGSTRHDIEMFSPGRFQTA
jgi:sarcosine oxidase